MVAKWILKQFPLFHILAFAAMALGSIYFANKDAADTLADNLLAGRYASMEGDDNLDR